MAGIEKKRGALMLFSNLSAGDAFTFTSGKDKRPHRYIKYDGIMNYYVDSGLLLTKRPNVNILDICKKSKKNYEVMFLQSNP